MDRIDLLVAKDAIADANRRYCRGIDRCDPVMVKSAYHPDAWDEHGSFKGNAWDFAEYATRSLRRYQATMHSTTNHSIDVADDGLTASGEIYTVAYHLRADPDGVQTVDVWWGRYIDQYEQRSGDWRISHRVCVHEWTMQLPIDKAMPIAAELFRAGSGDRIMESA